MSIVTAVLGLSNCDVCDVCDVCAAILCGSCLSRQLQYWACQILLAITRILTQGLSGIVCLVCVNLMRHFRGIHPLAPCASAVRDMYTSLSAIKLSMD